MPGWQTHFARLQCEGGGLTCQRLHYLKRTSVPCDAVFGVSGLTHVPLSKGKEIPKADVQDVVFDEGETAITGVSAAKPANGIIYDITGLRVSRMDTKGLYIVDGKKIVVK